MSCIQLTTVHPTSCTYAIANQLRYDSSAPCIFSLQHRQIRKVSMNLAASSSSYLGLQIHVKPWKFTPITSGCKQSTPACTFGGEGKSENDAKGSPWKSLEKAMSNLRKESSVEDLLREQIQKQEFYDGGSGGENTGGGGDSGSGGDDGSSPGESDDDMSLLGRIDEFFQVILAFTGFVIAYIFILHGEDILAVGRDMVKFLFTRKQSIRMGRFIRSCKQKRREIKNFFAAIRRRFRYKRFRRAIVRTRTWFDSPRKYQRLSRRYDVEEEEEEDDDYDDSD